MYPSHASVVTKYANFLKAVRGDLTLAEVYYLKVSKEWKGPFAAGSDNGRRA